MKGGPSMKRANPAKAIGRSDCLAALFGQVIAVGCSFGRGVPPKKTVVLDQKGHSERCGRGADQGIVGYKPVVPYGDSMVGSGRASGFVEVKCARPATGLAVFTTMVRLGVFG